MKKIIILAITIAILSAFLTTVNAEFQRVSVLEDIRCNDSSDNVDMLIFVSPQYANDGDILQAINNYVAVVEDDVNWSTEVISISYYLNDFKVIDNIIESYYENYSIKACIMVGEDTDTAISGDMDHIEGPSTVPWYTTGGEEAYEISGRGVLQTSNNMDICISLIYPTNDLDYATKKSQIISVFNKFSVQRHVYYTEDILVFIDSKLAEGNNRLIYQTMEEYGSLYYKEDPTQTEVQNSLKQSYSMYFTEGHSNPSLTALDPKGDTEFRASYLDQLNIPFYGATGCYVGGWWSDFPANNRLDPSVSKRKLPHYGSMIFTAPQLRVMVLGFLTQSGYSYPVSFIENAIPNLTDGKTLADSMIGHIYSGDSQTVVGDPTFHYSFYNEKPTEPVINGTADGKTGKRYEYTFNAEDPDGDAVRYFIDWGDGNNELTEFWLSGANISVEHIWETEGRFNISVKAIDSFEGESNCTYLEVDIEKTKIRNKPLILQLFKQFFNKLSLIRFFQKF